MLRKMRDLKGFAIAAKDGDIGEANDLIFDDKNWTVRYLVTKSGPEYDAEGSVAPMRLNSTGITVNQTIGVLSGKQ